MKYEKTPIKNSDHLGRKATIQAVESLGTPTLLWVLVKRHKMGLVSTWAVVMTALWLVPWLPDLLFGLIGR